VDEARLRAIEELLAAEMEDFRRREREWERQEEEFDRSFASPASKRGRSRDSDIRYERLGPPDDPVEEHLRALVEAEIGDGLPGDPRVFSRFLVQKVQSVYGENPVPFYTAAELSRSAYSKLVSHPERHPSKDTVLAMAAALKMDVPDAERFLKLAGYAFSDILASDIVWRTCFAKGLHNLPQIRELLAKFDS